MRGNILGSQVAQIYDEVFELVKVFADCKYDPLDPGDSVSRGAWAGSMTNALRVGKHAEGSACGRKKTAQELCPHDSELAERWVGLECTHSRLCMLVKVLRLGIQFASRVLMTTMLISRPKFKIWIGGWPPSSAKGLMTAILLSPVQR